MDDLISRQRAIDAVNCVMVMKGIRSGKSITAEAVDCAKRIIADNIRQLPPIQPKRGKWIKKHRHYGGFRNYTGFDAMGEQHTITVDERTEYDDLYCSECGARSADNFLNFCPNCGSRNEVTT